MIRIRNSDGHIFDNARYALRAERSPHVSFKQQQQVWQAWAKGSRENMILPYGLT